MKVGSGTLVRLNDGGHRLADPAHDVRGRQVRDCEGKDIGRVAELLVDAERGEVRLLQVEHGGLFGVGAGPLYIPADCVESATADVVVLDRTRVQVAGAPAYDAEPVGGDEAFADMYEYYGIAAGGEPDRVPWTAKLFR